MIVAFQDNRANGASLRTALLDAGHQVEDALPLLRAGKVGDVLLTDYDAGPPYDTLCDAHEKVLVHPHGAGLVGWTEPHAHTLGQFVHGPGQVEVLRRAGYPRRAEVIGWNFCEQLPFRGKRAIHLLPRVLFGLQHSMHDGFIEPWMPPLHNEIFKALVSLPIHLTIRKLAGGTIEFHPHPDNQFVVVQIGDGTVADAVKAVDAADVVIGPAYTLPCIAIARGVPTIMYGQTPRAVEGYGLPAHPLASWEKYKSFAEYPMRAEWAELSDDGMNGLLGMASRQEDVTWRSDFIGPAFDPGAFVTQFDRAVKEW